MREHAQAALTLLEALVLVAFLAALLLLFLRTLQAPRVGQDWGSCIIHLKSVGTSFSQWAEENGGRLPMQVSVTDGGTMEFVPEADPTPHLRVLSNYLGTPICCWCPKDAGRIRGRSFPELDRRHVSYFVGLDVATNQSAMLLAGDRKLAIRGSEAGLGLLSLSGSSEVGWATDIHRGRGNVVFADGHAEQGTSADLREWLRRASAINRLANP